MKITLLLIVLTSSTCFGQITTYTLVPNSNKSFWFKSQAGQSVRPSNSVFLQYSKDSQKVQFVNVFDKSLQVMSVPDSVTHFYSTGFHFVTKSSLDSFYKNVLCK